MANNNTIGNEIRPKVDAFVQEISDMVRRAALDSVREALQEGGGATPARRGPGRPKKASMGATTKKAATAPVKRRGRPGRRSPEEIEAASEAILAQIRANPGQSSEEIKAALGLKVEDFQLPVAKLLADGKVRTEGQRRGTKYFAGGGGAGRKRTRKASKKAGKKRAVTA